MKKLIKEILFINSAQDYLIFIKAYILLALSAVLIGCNSGIGVAKSADTNDLIVKSNKPITIDNASIVPLLKGLSTNSLIYVHNNSNKTISGINYTIKNNNLTPDNVTLWKNECTSISAYSRCALHFTINALSAKIAQSSAIIEAHSMEYSFSQILNYAYVYDNQHGIIMNSSLELNTFGNPTAYGTLYAYAGAGDNYTLSTMLSDNPHLNFVDNYFGQSLLANNIIALEVSSSSQALRTTTLKLNSMSATRSYSSNINISEVKLANGAILSSGLVPLINTSNTTTGSLAIVNAGNATATLGNISYPNGVVAATGSSQCGATLNAGASCNIYFTTPKVGGNGIINIPYTGGISNTFTQTVTWYNSQSDGALVQMNANPNLITLNLGSSQTTVLVLLTNLGTYPLTNITATATTYTGNATTSITNDNCTGTSLASNASCSYMVNISDSVVETNQQLKFEVSANYNDGSSKNYSRVLAINYTTNNTPAFYSLSAGSNSLCAIKNNTFLSCWGINGFGSLGTGNNASTSPVPLKVMMPSGVTSWRTIIGSASNQCAIAESGINAGNLYCWGNNSAGQNGTGSTIGSMSNTPTLVPLPNGVSSWQEIYGMNLGASSTTLCALANTGNLYCWGLGTNGTLGNGSNTNVNLPSLVALPNEIGVTSWGNISLINGLACALVNTGNLYCWGLGSSGQIGNGANNNVNIPTLVTKPSGVASWSSYIIGLNQAVCALANTGNLYCWGSGSSGQLGNGSTSNVNIPTLVTQPAGVSNWTKLSPMNAAFCGLANNNQIYCWGAGTNGQIGNGANNNVSIPTLATQPAGVTSWISLLSGGNTSCGLANTGNIYCWGFGTSGEIGNGANSTINKPTLVTLPNGVSSWSNFLSSNGRIIPITI